MTRFANLAYTAQQLFVVIGDEKALAASLTFSRPASKKALIDKKIQQYALDREVTPDDFKLVLSDDLARSIASLSAGADAGLFS